MGYEHVRAAVELTLDQKMPTLSKRREEHGRDRGHSTGCNEARLRLFKRGDLAPQGLVVRQVVKARVPYVLVNTFLSAVLEH